MGGFGEWKNLTCVGQRKEDHGSVVIRRVVPATRVGVVSPFVCSIRVAAVSRRRDVEVLVVRSCDNGGGDGGRGGGGGW